MRQIVLAAALAAVPAVAVSQAGCPATSEAENVEIARKWHEEVINRRHPQVLREILGATVGFDDFITEDDMVVERYTATGTQAGPLGAFAATGRQATWTGVNIFRLDCGRIVEVWSEVDALTRQRQLAGP